MHRFLIIFLSAALLLMVAGRTAVRLIKSEPTYVGSVKIAFAGPLSGTGQTGGEELLSAAQALADEVNAAGGVNGLKVELVPFDDANNADRARAAAEEIAKRDDILAVIGHNYSSASLAAAPTYAAAGIPAVSPASTNPNVTKGNPWYFRSIFSDVSQGAFLARYARDALDAREAVVISTIDPYAKEVASSFTQAAGAAGVEIRGAWALDAKAPDFDAAATDAVAALGALPKDAVIMLMAHIDPASVVTRKLRDAGLRHRILGPDSLGSARFAQVFAALPNEQARPGFYTDGLFVSVPFLTDTGNQEARRLINRLEAKRGPLTTWGAPFAYDAAKLIVTAMRRADLRPGGPTTAEARAAIRDQLTNMRSGANAISGATGSLRFDNDNTPQKSLVIGQFRDRLISSLVQLSFDSESGTLRKTPVVYAGMAMERVDTIDPRGGTARLAFDLWFRFQGALPVGDVVFSNAVEPISLGQPEESISAEGVEYRLYRVSGRFKMDFDDRRPAPGNHVVGLEFHHRNLSRDQLIYVADRVSQPAAGDGARSQVAVGDWRILKADASANIIDLPTKGNPFQARSATGMVNASNFVYRSEIAPKDLGIRRQLAGDAALAATVGATLLLIGALLLDARGGPKSRWRRGRLGAVAAAASLFLIASESVLYDAIADMGYDGMLEQAATMFDALWWVVAGIIINMAIRRFLWEPLEQASERVVPRVIQTFVGFSVYMMVAFGIFAGVFQKDITSLLATSGMLAMIVGLAVQSNLSNIFSGIALNIERPFRPGDWVKIGEAPMGKVVDMSWRATKIETFSNSVVNIPNSLAAGSRIENCSFPNRRYFIFQTLHFDPRHDPARLTQLLLDGLRLTESVDGRKRLDLTWVKFNGADEMGLKFLVAFDVHDRALMNSQEHAALTSINNVLRAAGVRLSTRHTTMHVLQEEPDTAMAAMECEALLSAIPAFAGLDDATRERWARAAARRMIAPGEVLLRAGEPASSLFIIADGVASLHAPTEGEPETARIGAGGMLGDSALQGPAPHAATAKAVGPMVVYEIRLES